MKILLICVLIVFSVITVLAVKEVGYWGIIEPHFQSWGQGQVLADLIIACVLACIWMTADARERGISAWPYVAVTLAAGSFGPLLYLLVRELRRAPAR